MEKKIRQLHTCIGTVPVRGRTNTCRDKKQAIRGHEKKRMLKFNANHWRKTKLLLPPYLNRIFRFWSEIVAGYYINILSLTYRFNWNFHCGYDSSFRLDSWRDLQQGAHYHSFDIRPTALVCNCVYEVRPRKNVLTVNCNGYFLAAYQYVTTLICRPWYFCQITIDVNISKYGNWKSSRNSLRPKDSCFKLIGSNQLYSLFSILRDSPQAKLMMNQRI